MRAGVKWKLRSSRRRRIGAQGGRMRDVSIWEGRGISWWLGLGWDGWGWAYGSQTPVEQGYEAFDWRGGDGEGVFEGEEAGAQG